MQSQTLHVFEYAAAFQGDSKPALQPAAQDVRLLGHTCKSLTAEVSDFRGQDQTVTLFAELLHARS